MKKIILTSFLVISGLAYSQWNLPAASPRAKVEQQFSTSQISVDYGRPGVKGRKVFGELVPYNVIWRAGANSATKITFGQSVDFGGTTIPAGTYGLFIVPSEKEWKVILNKDAQQWGAYTYDSKQDVAVVKVPVQNLSDKQEWFEISLFPVDDHSVNMIFKWDNVKVEVPIKSGTMSKSIRIVEKLKEVRAIEREK